MAVQEPGLDSNQATRRPDSFYATVGNVRSELREILSMLSNHQPSPRQRAVARLRLTQAVCFLFGDWRLVAGPAMATQDC